MNKAARTLPNQRLRRERELRGWSQEDVAKKIGAPDDKTVRRWESGKVQYISNREVSVNWTLDGRPQGPTPHILSPLAPTIRRCGWVRFGI